MHKYLIIKTICIFSVIFCLLLNKIYVYRFDTFNLSCMDITPNIKSLQMYFVAYNMSSLASYCLALIEL